MEEKIYIFLENIRPEVDFHSSEDFVEDAFLDSFDIITLVSDLESEFSIIIDGMEIIPDNFVSVKAIYELIQKSERR